MHETHGRLAAIMFVQITEASDNSREIPVASILSMEDRQELCDHVKSFHGAVVDIRAGELFAHFPGAVVAFNAAMSLMQRMSEFNFRIGLHVGEIPYREGRFQGADVNLTSRLPAFARAGGICLTQKVFQYLPESEQRKLITLGTHELKNIAIDLTLYARLPAGQARRSKTREWKDQLVTAVRKYHRYALLLFLTSTSSIVVWSYYWNFFSTEQGMVHLYLPGFNQPAAHKQENNLKGSIEMTLRSRLSALDDLHITEIRSDAVFELLLMLDPSPGKSQVSYVLNRLPQGVLLESGVIVGDEYQLFRLQDRLSEKIIQSLRQHKIIHTPLASHAVRIKLDVR